MSQPEVKEQVRRFYDQVGWQMTGDTYQNARYEDLRPVSREYIHRCHLRLKPFLQPGGRFLLDAGSGPVQYPEYLTYSMEYQKRVCLDISFVALQEARRRVGEHGLYVVGDVANLPFCSEAFDGVVSLHTLHHLPLVEQKKAYEDIYRVLQSGRRAVVVNGWTESPLMRLALPFVRMFERLGGWLARLRGRARNARVDETMSVNAKPSGTFVQKLDAAWLRQEIGDQMPVEIRVWRSVSVRFLRAVIHEALAGRFWLRLLFWLEERFPHYFGEHGQYPLIVIRKEDRK
jgi:hypothetical protein